MAAAQGQVVRGRTVRRSEFLNWVRQKEDDSRRAQTRAIAEVSALVCHGKCVVKGCPYSCAENPSLVVAGVAHEHLCAVHRDMSAEARAARLENAPRWLRLCPRAPSPAAAASEGETTGRLGGRTRRRITNNKPLNWFDTDADIADIGVPPLRLPVMLGQ